MADQTIKLKATLAKPYGTEDHAAVGFTLEITAGAYPAQTTVTTRIPMAEAATLLRELAAGFKAYRESSQSHFGQTLDEAVKEATAAFE